MALRCARRTWRPADRGPRTRSRDRPSL